MPTSASARRDPAEEAVLAEAEARSCGARRTFIASTGSLARPERAPLQRIERALGAAHAGTDTGVRSHCPREDGVQAPTPLARPRPA